MSSSTFANDAMSAASSKGMPVVRIVPETIVSESTVVEDIEAAVKAVFNNVVAVLTKPLTDDEKAPKRREPENPPRIVFKGTLAEVNQFFYQRGWTDGLPIIPPTEEAVAEMMTGTDLPADHLVEKLEPRLGKATIEKIAINAVMAGCLPTYMPLLIAGVHALAANPVCGMMAASTGSFAPFWLVNGPIAKDINVRSTYGATSPGDIANASFGRAMGLITKNIRGIRKQIEDMGVLGNPGKYSWVAAENEENSPWEPLHVERGFKKEDSTLTLMFPQSFQQMMPFGTDAKGILATVVGSVVPARMGSFAVLLTPTNAGSLAKGGWSKKAVKEFIVKNAVVPGWLLYRGSAWTTVNPSTAAMSSSPARPIKTPFLFPARATPTPFRSSFSAGSARGWALCRAVRRRSRKKLSCRRTGRSLLKNTRT